MRDRPQKRVGWLFWFFYNVCVYAVRGIGAQKNGAQRNVKPDLLRNCPPTAD